MKPSTFFKSISTAFVSFATALSASAAPVWTTGNYDPAAWVPGKNNMLAGVRATVTPNLFTTDTHGNPSQDSLTLTDGTVPGTTITDIKGIYAIIANSGNVFEWTLPQAGDLYEFRYYSRWYDGGRDGINLKSLEYKRQGGSTWHTITSTRCQYGHEKNNTSGALYATLKNPDYSPLAENVVALRLVVSTVQENSGAGIVEIEALGASDKPVADLNIVPDRTSATLSGTLHNCGVGASSVTLSYAIAREGETLPEETSFGILSVDTSFSIPLNDLRIHTPYQYRLTFRNNLGETLVESGSFTTAQEPILDFTYAPGLWEVQIRTRGDDWTTDAWAIPEGLEAGERHRELGAEMAYTTGKHVSSINGQTYEWANNSIFAYVGYMYIQPNTTYLFESSIDDTAYLKIGDEVVHNITTYTQQARSTWTSGAEGWFPVDLRVGDFTGGHGPIGINSGFRFSTDNGETWTLARDPGDGSLFVIDQIPRVNILSVANTGSELRLELSIPEGIEGAPLTACYAPTYGAESLESWTTAALAPVAANETYRSTSVAIPEGTRFFRIYATYDGLTSWTATVELADIPVIEASMPVATLGEVLSTDFTTASFTANVISTGDGYTACDLEVAYGTDPAGMTYSATYPAKAVGTYTLALDALLPNRTYFVALRSSNATSTSDWSEPISFQTPALQTEETDTPTAESLPGLWQACVDNNYKDWTTDIRPFDFGIGPNDRRRALGAQMAYTVTPRANDFLPSVTDSWRERCTWIYAGYIFLEAGTYNFRSYFDDTVSVKIGDTVVHRFETYTANAQSTWTCPATGWYALDLRLGNNTVDAGPMSGHPAEEGLQFSTDNKTTWRTFVDPGDGSFLRTELPTIHSIDLVSYSIDNNSLSAQLSFGSETEDSFDLYVAYGATPGSTDPASWEHAELVTTLDANTSTYSFSGIPGASSTIPYARFYLVENSRTTWTKPIFLGDPTHVALADSFAVDAHLGDTLIISSSLLSAGNNDTVDVYALVSTNADLAEADVWPLGSFSSGDPIVSTLHSASPSAALAILPGTDYFVALLAQGADGTLDRTTPLAITTPAEASFDTPTATSSIFEGAFNVKVTDIGAGDATTISLWVGTSADTLTQVGTTTISEPQPVGFTHTFNEFTVYYYQFRAENACDTESWVATTPIATLDLQDPTTYYWRASVTQGDWSNPANWETDSGDPRLLYPNGPSAKANFTRCANATITVNLDGIYTAKRLELTANGLHLTLLGTDADSSRLTTTDGNATMTLAANETFLLQAAYLYVRNVGFNNNCTVRLSDHAYLHSNTECSIGQNDVSILVEDGSTFYIQNFLLRMNGINPFLRIDNATFQLNGTIAPNSNSQAKGTVIEFAGTNPQLRPGNVIPSEQTGNPITGAEEPIFRFVIPAEGYTDEPRIQVKGNFPGTERIPIRFEIAKDSPWYHGSKTKSFQLVKAGAIYTSSVDFADQPRPDITRFYYTYGANNSLENDGKAPTGLWVEVQSIGATILYFR